MESTLTKSQKKQFGPRFYKENGREYRITAVVRFDDECGNGRNSFSITGSIDLKSGNRWVDDACGCIHDEIRKHFPELAQYIKWHLCDTSGPMHYIANTVYHAGDRDHNGLREGEFVQFRNKKTGKLSWKLDDQPEYSKRYVDSDTCPEPIVLKYVPWGCTGEGKKRDLDAARSCAVWPEATDEELTAPGLEERLKERAAALTDDFRKAVESLGFTW